jgi:Ger(x)C family germination protein
MRVKPSTFRHHSHVALFLVLLLAGMLLTGCWDRRDIEQRTLVSAIGIDKGTAGDYLISIQVPIPNQIAGSTGTGGGGGGEAYRVITSTGDTLMEGLNNLQKRTNQMIFVGHTRVIAISEEVARENITSIIDGLRRKSSFRRLLWPIVVHGEARNLLTFSPKLEQLPTVFVMDQLKTSSQLGILPKLSLGDMYIAMSKTTEEPIAYYARVSKEDIQLDRLAVFRGNRMVGHLDTHEIIPLIHIRNQRNGPDVTVPIDPEKNVFVTFHPKKTKTRIDARFEGGKPRFQICIRMDGSITESTYKEIINPVRWMNEVEQATAAYYEKLAKKTLQKLQKEYHADILRLGTLVRGRYPEAWKKIDSWETLFSNAEIQVTYDVRIRQTGLEKR